MDYVLSEVYVRGGGKAVVGRTTVSGEVVFARHSHQLGDI